MPYIHRQNFFFSPSPVQIVYIIYVKRGIVNKTNNDRNWSLESQHWPRSAGHPSLKLSYTYLDQKTEIETIIAPLSDSRITVFPLNFGLTDGRTRRPLS